MTSKVYDTMVLLPENEYLMLKEKNTKPTTTSNNNKVNTQPSHTTNNTNPNRLPGILPEQIEKHSTTKEQASTNWGLLWEPL